jgi:hypothetical protein
MRGDVLDFTPPDPVGPVGVSIEKPGRDAGIHQGGVFARHVFLNDIPPIVMMNMQSIQNLYKIVISGEAAYRHSTPIGPAGQRGRFIT